MEHNRYKHNTNEHRNETANILVDAILGLLFQEDTQNCPRYSIGIRSDKSQPDQENLNDN